MGLTIGLDYGKLPITDMERETKQTLRWQYIDLETKVLFAASSLKNMSCTQKMSVGLAKALRNIATELEKAVGK